MSRATTLPRARKAKPKAHRLPLPSRGSILVGLGLLALGAGLYGVGRETSAFAVRTVEVSGGSPVVRRQVQQAVAKLHGTSLLALDGAALVRTV
ncbi:MAG: hypothetical protein ABUS54_05500, partial [Actinomycetota bacterium]